MLNLDKNFLADVGEGAERNRASRLLRRLPVCRTPQRWKRDARAGRNIEWPGFRLHKVGFAAGCKRRIAGRPVSLARFPVPGQVSCLEAQAKLNVFEPMLHSSLELLYTHLVPHVDSQCVISTAMPVIAPL